MDETTQRLRVDHFVAFDSGQVFADEVQLSAGHYADENPIEERTDGRAGQQKVPEPEE